MKPIDIDRCQRAMQDVYVSGNPGLRLCAAHTNQNEGGHPRHRLIEDAISRIGADPQALSKEYLWVKNYASFGDQSGYSEYGMGPSYGSVVFSIGRTRDARRENRPLGADHMYLLECVRDAGTIKDGDRELNLINAIDQMVTAAARAAVLSAWVSGVSVESHEERTGA